MKAPLSAGAGKSHRRGIQHRAIETQSSFIAFSSIARALVSFELFVALTVDRLTCCDARSASLKPSSCRVPARKHVAAPKSSTSQVFVTSMAAESVSTLPEASDRCLSTQRH
jgi:hypothetical protein